MLLSFGYFYDCHFSVSINPYKSQVQSSVTVLKLIQNIEQSDKQNRNKVPYLEIFQYLKPFNILKLPFVENEKWWTLMYYQKM